MPDPFLRSLQCAPCHFDLGGFVPFSIRDQLVRARLFVDRTCASVRLSRRKILVKGAGVAGIAVASRAAALDIRSLIVEKGVSSLGRFAECSSRWIEPTHYDWPHDHWLDGKLPGLALPYRCGYAGQLSSRWREELKKLEAAGSVFTYANVKEFAWTPISSDPPGIKANLGFPAAIDEFDLLVDCTGPGDEDSSVDSYQGFHFWQTDPYGTLDLGLPEGVIPRVLISGAGDGAIQDFLRIATGEKSPGRLLVRLLGSDEPVLRKYFHTPEDQARRELAWASKPEHRHATMKRLDQAYPAALARLSSAEPVLWQRMQQKLDAMLEPGIRDGRIIHIAHPCDHLSGCYPLNRLLARLVMGRLTRIDSKRFTFLSGSGTQRIQGVGHECESADQCHGVDHDVHFIPSHCLPGMGAPVLDRGSYNVIVVRHGVGRDRPPKKPQVLPFYFA